MREGIPQKSRIGLMLRISLVLSVGVVIGGGVYVAVWSIITPRLAMLDSHEEVRCYIGMESSNDLQEVIIMGSILKAPSALSSGMVMSRLEDQLNHAEGMMKDISSALDA
ncbi:hypothetical protein FOZ63_001239 [Perkinsus olseni]|uniref:Uncharacterized protein n=1 Tax=Perkinsus olseni TaxID=32597 RepID=A0A7J6SQD9_PEROL|nr:hypothetical protein FOZ63_001239 [Perkinsus olseni]